MNESTNDRVKAIDELPAPTEQ